MYKNHTHIRRSKLPDVLADFFKQYPSVINELVSQIGDGALHLNIDVTALQPVTGVTNTDIQEMINDAIANLRGSIDSELREIKHDISLISETTNQLADFQADVTVAHQRLETLEAIATAKKPLLQIAREKVLAA